MNLMISIIFSLKTFESELRRDKWTDDGLQNLIDTAKKISWDLMKNFNLDERAKRNIREVKHPGFLSILLDIVKMLPIDTVQDLWDSLCPIGKYPDT